MRLSPLLLPPASALLVLACSSHVVRIHPDRTLRSDTLSRDIRIELARNPTVSDPRIIFRSAMETERVDEVEHTAEYAYRPRPALTWTLLGTCGLAFLLSEDMRYRGFPAYASTANTVAWTTGLAAGLLHFGLPKARHRAIRRESAVRKSSVPLDVDVSLKGGLWQQRLITGANSEAELELSSILDVLSTRKNINLEAHVADMPEHACNVKVDDSLVDSLVEERARERRLKEEEARRKYAEEQQRLREAEEQRRAEAEAPSRIWRTLTLAEQNWVARSFDFAKADFQIAVTRGTDLKTYGDFLALGPEGRLRVLRMMGRSVGKQLWSLLLQQTLDLPPYLAEAILR